NYGIQGGHSIAAWGDRLGIPKVGKDITDWSRYTSLMRDRCISDTKINVAIYEYFKKYLDRPEFKRALESEHILADICAQLHNNGLEFDVDRAKALRSEIADIIQPIDEALVTSFPPKAKPVGEVTPKLTKQGTLSLVPFKFLGPNPDLTPYTEGASFTRVDFIPFNPASPPQMVERLNAAGWKPVEKTKGHLECERDLANLRRRTKKVDPKL